MALCAYKCENCNKEFNVFYISLKAVRDKAECPNCKAECPETFGIMWKQSYGYDATKE